MGGMCGTTPNRWEKRAASSRAGTAAKTHTRQLVWSLAGQLWVTVDAPARTPLTKTNFETLRSEARRKARAWFNEQQAKVSATEHATWIRDTMKVPSRSNTFNSKDAGQHGGE